MPPATGTSNLHSKACPRSYHALKPKPSIHLYATAPSPAQDDAPPAHRRRRCPPALRTALCLGSYLFANTVLGTALPLTRKTRKGSATYFIPLQGEPSPRAETIPVVAGGGYVAPWVVQLALVRRKPMCDNVLWQNPAPCRQFLWIFPRQEAATVSTHTRLSLSVNFTPHLLARQSGNS